ncbi:ATP-binding protein [Actinoplanes sp. NPDC023714]|uniref:ATP-binding protein n=1 Tax=Actinoplanes sp. NPDC023714 TaxID=3154322 RepID=UPI003404D16C
MAESPAEADSMSYADHGDLRVVRGFVAERAGRLGLPAARIDLLVLAVSELTTNTLMHTDGGGLVRVWAEKGNVICDVTDSGGPRTFGRSMPPAQTIGGRGLAIVERICDSVKSIAVPGGTLVRICLAL